MAQAPVSGVAAPDPFGRDTLHENEYERWKHWHVNWTAVNVGALSSIAAVIIFSLIGVAIGAHLLGPDSRVVDFKKTSIVTLALSIFGAFLAYVIGGWVAGKIAGILHAEPAMLHGGIVWLVSIPLLIVLLGLGAGSAMGGWYAGLSGKPSWSSDSPYDRPEPLSPSATDAERTQHYADQADYRNKVRQWREDSPKVARNSALGAITALLLGLIGSVIGGWMACGEPMTFTHVRTHSRMHPRRLDGPVPRS